MSTSLTTDAPANLGAQTRPAHLTFAYAVGVSLKAPCRVVDPNRRFWKALRSATRADRTSPESHFTIVSETFPQARYSETIGRSPYS